MSYARVIPRDLFNEASLLKCLGRLFLCTEGLEGVELGEPEGEEPFAVEQDPADGSLSVANVPLRVRGVPFRLFRPLNSREPWPLWCESPFACDEEEVQVFDAEGNLSAAFLTMIGHAPKETA